MMCRPRRLPVVFLVLLLGGLGLAACESGTPEADDAADAQHLEDVTATTDPPNQMPEWLNSVQPSPGDQVSPEPLVIVDVNLQLGNQVARLIVDGVDVTAAATEPADINPSVDESAGVTTPNRLVYDTDELENPPVALDPGLHLGTVRLLHYPEGFEAGDFDVEGSFTWSFEIL